MGRGQAAGSRSAVIIIFRPEAQLDLAEAYQWYEERDRGLGAEFIRAIEASLDQIKRHPEMYPVVHDNVRQAITRRFPFSVFYIILQETVHVVAVFHASRKPQNWKDRLSEPGK